MTPKFWNLGIARGADGSKHLDIQIHGEIDGGGWMGDEGVDTSALVGEMQKHLDAKTIGVRINSVGGSVFGGVSMYNALQSHPADVTCTVEGLAASAASLVAMAGKCVMGTGAMMMVHKPLMLAMGNADDLRKSADVLDKVQEALAGIYTAKTGKSLDEINGMLDDETWMTADEAVAKGFADEVMPDVKTDYGPGTQVPAEQKDFNDDAADGDEEEGEGDPDTDDPDEPMMLGDAVKWRGVVFPVNKLPQQIVAMAKTPVPPKAPALAIVPPPAAKQPEATITIFEPPLARADIERRAPAIVAALIEEGRVAGVAAERARLKEIDELGVRGCADLVHAAKYGDKPSDAPTLAMAVVRAGQVAGADMLALRRQESEQIAAVTQSAPSIDTDRAAEARLIKAMVDGGNARRGEKR